jgi:hypothetical protein
VFPEIWRVMISNPTQSLFLGTFPMGLATIINMIVFVCVPAWGDGAVKLVSLLPLNRSLISGLTFSRHGRCGGLT